MLFADPAHDVLSVSELNRLARQLLEEGVPPAWISGEISNLTLAASGHAYFSLKDASAQLRCVMFRNRVAALGLKLREGLQVELKGQVTLYEARGDFQINVETLRTAGLGRLFEAFERLKARLAAEGLFATERKRPLPAHPRAIGIVTSPAAAALRDVVTTLRRRMPSIPVVLYPAPVQGDGAAARLAEAVAAANRRNEVDVLIVCRGGGSIEDLWAFNEEVLARAVAASRLPVISGVGHETDFTICDFVADQRAPTPTAAAELVSPNREQLLLNTEMGRRRLERAWARLFTDKTQQLDYLARRLVHPREKLQRQTERLHSLEARLKERLTTLLEARRWAVERAAHRLERQRPDVAVRYAALGHAADRLARGVHQLIHRHQGKIERLDATLAALNPEAVLNRGYAIVQKRDGTPVKSPAQLRHGEAVTLRLAEGDAGARIDLAPGQQTELPF